MRRFLLYISYCGTRFRGVQRQPNEELRKLPRSVQGLLEEGLLSLYPANTPHLYFSSRTDKGVHALSNTAHVDLCRKTEGLFYDPDVITGRLNKYLSHEGHDIRSHFDIEKFVSGCHLLQGSHNFATFMSAPSKTTYPIDPNRCLDSITVEEGRPFLDPGYEQLYERLQLWDVKLSAKAFLHNQVRRIVGAAVGVAQGKISLDCIQAMLDNPAPQNWNTRVSPVPACGLYLLQVKYPSEVFEESFHQGNIQEKSTL
ncbi:tRNA pseudouridine synthase-like 1 isoform X3 [Macrobrachium rosenbergii]|uniref:tRNA pseudouridine synthase-like 1 isoform X3 n=1 Tax=Macrobrachium rosenbergii TaxID=79674 RepID=UPI0034D73855